MPNEIPYTDAQIAQHLEALTHWSYEDGAIRRTYDVEPAWRRPSPRLESGSERR